MDLEYLNYLYATIMKYSIKILSSYGSIALHGSAIEQTFTERKPTCLPQSMKCYLYLFYKCPLCQIWFHHHTALHLERVRAAYKRLYPK